MEDSAIAPDYDWLPATPTSSCADGKAPLSPQSLCRTTVPQSPTSFRTTPLTPQSPQGFTLSESLSDSRMAPPLPDFRGTSDGHSLTAKATSIALATTEPPICVVDGITGERLCEIPAKLAPDGLSIKAAVRATCGLRPALQRLVWCGQALGRGPLPGIVARSGVREVRLVRVEDATWNRALDRCVASTDAGLVPPDLRDDLWPTEGFPVSAEDYELLHKRGFVLALVQQDGKSLRLVPEHFRADREVVLAAVQECGAALVWAPEDLRSDREVVVAALNQDGTALEFAGQELRSDPEIVLLAIEQHGEALQYALGERCCLDRDLALAAVRRSSSALRLAHFGLLKERDFVLDAVKANGDALHYVPDCFRRDKELALAASAFWVDKGSYRTSALLPERAREFVTAAGARAVQSNQEN